MSFQKKFITAYSKALFQNVQNAKKNQKLKFPGNSNHLETWTASGLDLNNIFSSAEDVRKLKKSPNFVPSLYLIGQELSFISGAISACPTLKNYILNPTYKESQKLEILLGLIPGLSSITDSFLKVLTDRSHLAMLPEITENFKSVLLKFEKTVFLKLILANPLPEESGDVLEKTLRKLSNQNYLILLLTYSPKLLGGFIVEYNSNSIDVSLLKEFGLLFTEN